MTVDDAYARSDAVEWLNGARGAPARRDADEPGASTPMRLAFLDIDSTLTGDPAGADRVRHRLEAQGFVCVFVTSRTEEMVMSSAAFRASRRSGELMRPEPHLGRRGAHRFYLPPEQVEPDGLLDGEIIAGSSGSRIFVRHDGAYRLDRDHGATELPPDAWREEALALLAEVNGPVPAAEPAAIESAESYETGESDVFPPDYRIQLHFPDGAVEARFRGGLASMRAGPEGTFARTLRVLDDSHPAEGRYKAFLLPRWASKARAVTRIVRALCSHLPARRPVEVLFIGDSYPDLEMGLFGAPGCPGTLFLVAGSRLSETLLSPQPCAFAGEPLGAIQRRLRSTGTPGHFRFQVPLHPSGGRRMVIGDLAFPGSAAVASIERFLAR